MLQTSIVGEVKTTATIVDTKINDNPSFFNQMNGSGMVEDLQSIPESLNSSTDSLKENTALLKEFGNIMPEMIKNLRAMNDIVVRTNQNLPAVRKNVTSEELRQRRQGSLIDQGLLSFANNGSGIVQSYANGNFGGVVSGALNGTTNTLNNASRMADNADMANLAAGLAKAGIVAAIAGAVVKGADTLATKYVEEMPTLFSTGRAFGDMGNAGAMAAYDRINSFNTGTNLSVAEFQGVAQSLRQQGVGNGLGRAAQMDLVGSIAQRTSQLAYLTGGDANQYASLAGLMSRYGGSKDVAGDFEKLIAAGRASGLNDTQLPEFLSSVQKVMEDGIAKGFSRSATEVASTMLMFSKMSGNNAFWQGEQGAKIINQANAGLASATGLSKTADILAYRAINRAFSSEADKEAQLGSDLYLQGGGYVNNMMLLEQGLNAKNFGAIMGAISESTDSKEGQIERIRQMFGVNYTGASRILQLNPENFKGNEAAFEAELKKIQNDPEMQNNETRNQKALNDIKAAVVKAGESLASLKITGMEEIAGTVDKIEHWLGLTYGDKEKQAAIDNKKKNLTAAQKEYLEKNKMTYGFRDEDEQLEFLDALSNWNGFGRIPGITDDHIFNNDVSDSLLTGESGEGAWGLDNGIGKKNMFEFLKLGFGKEILRKFGGNQANANMFIKTLTESSQAANFRARVKDWSDDKVYTKDEQQKTLELIYDLLAKGITLNENK